MSRVLRRNATRQIAALRATHTAITSHHVDNDYVAGPCKDPDYPWRKWQELHNAQASVGDDGVVTITLHGNHWFKLRRPDESPDESPDDVVWLVHECEGQTFEQRLPRGDAHTRLAQLRADETVANARIE